MQLELQAPAGETLDQFVACKGVRNKINRVKESLRTLIYTQRVLGTLRAPTGFVLWLG